ncbi:MAG: thiol reductant ABC exporter subunit CydC [Ancalomicrobiaceae bacterium]|nr:thiol reductant ABC exporter subunit CydC [Ancalomicrobiaceae bacterium]
MKDLLRLIAVFGTQWRWMALAGLVSLVAIAANIGLMAVSGWFIAAMAAAGLSGASLNYFTPSAFIRLTAILRTGGRYAERLIAHETTFRLLARFRTHLFARLVPLIPGSDGMLTSSDLAVRLKGDVDRLELVFLRLIAPVTVAAGTGIGVTLGLALIDGRLAAAIGALFLCALLAVPALSFAGWQASRAVAEATAGLKQRSIETLAGLAPLVVTGAIGPRIAALKAEHRQLLADQRRVMRVAALGSAGIGLIGDAAVWVAAALGLALLGDGRLSGPGLTMVVLTAMAAFEAFAALPDAAAGVFGAVASARRLFALIDRPPAFTPPQAAAATAGSFDLALDHVGLVAAPGGEAILDGIDLAIGQGRHVALVGPSGAGKSSLIQLMTRLDQPSTGGIRLGGVPLANIGEADLRRTITALSQEPHVFTATIADNLRLAMPTASDATLWDALRLAGLADMVQRLPDGLATPVGAFGTRLSGGELRRLALARVMLRAAPIVILDEPTEGLDPLTAAGVMANVAQRLAGRTLIVSTHRPASLGVVDGVIELRDGRLVEAAGPDRQNRHP